MMIKPVKSVQAIVRYKGVQPATKESTISGEVLKLDGNENPYGLPDSIRLSEEDYKSLHLYPDPLSSELVTLIATKEKLAINNIFVAAGSDELIDLLIHGYVEPDELVLTVSPTFGMYKYLAEVNGVLFKSIDMELQETSIEKVVQYNLNHEKFLKEAELAKIIFLARPNNPDGQMLSKEFIRKLLSLNVLVVIDEAYIEFTDKPSLVTLVNTYDNLVLLRTFSKAYALGGVRIGYGIMSSEIKETLLTIKQPYNVNVLAQKLAYMSIQSSDVVDNVQKIIQTRNTFISKLKELVKRQIVFAIHISEGPYVLLTFYDSQKGQSFYQFMRQNNILIRYYDPKDHITNIRISISQREHMEKVLAYIRKFIELS